MAQNIKNFGKCGILACIVILIMGTIFGSIGIVAAHSLMKHLSHYYLILIPPFVLAIVVGLGLNWGARIGRCSRFNVVTFFLVFLFSLGSYGSILFLNEYHDSFPEPPSLVQEGLFLVSDSINLLAELPFVSDYIKPIEVQTLQNALANVPLVSDFLPPAQHAGQENPDAESPTPEGNTESNAGEVTETGVSTAPRAHLGTQITAFLKAFPDQAFAPKPIVIGTIFDLVIFVPVQNYLLYPGITRWEEDNGVRQLVFDERAVQPWMAWTVEFFFLWFITLFITHRGTKKAYRKYQKRLEKRGGSPQQRLQLGVKKKPEPEKKEKKGLFGRKKNVKKEEEDTQRAAPENMSGDDELHEEGVALKTKKKKVKVKKKKQGWFGRKKQETEELDAVGAAVVLPETAGAGSPQGSPESDIEFEFSEAEEDTQEQLFAIILHQYDRDRQDDLIRLIQQVGQVSEERARKLLKAPSLIKRNVTTQQANIAIDKFNQVQAQVKLITMDQLLQLQNKQQQAATRTSTDPSPQPASSNGVGERYALILRKFDTTQRKQVLDLLSSLSGTPVADLQQSLKPPALVLRDASKDEVTMIAQQFKNIHADVKLLTMAELQRLMAKK